MKNTTKNISELMRDSEMREIVRQNNEINRGVYGSGFVVQRRNHFYARNYRHGDQGASDTLRRDINQCLSIGGRPAITIFVDNLLKFMALAVIQLFWCDSACVHLLQTKI